ncbi:uncharacterized protein LOC116850608 [Odontomachus brunneus]|uniref:uncharacterized protein LOC116847397 n=1 Tax=Odontomachus brunneus TaxID=486640 RepID=UPI0013F254A5|nr:uncharacterized protein LOC116847397 [Odontomachus brunneus]XP_032684995.1 uncharacterized protein LOC116850608 [Odontomachus brunneus]
MSYRRAVTTLLTLVLIKSANLRVKGTETKAPYEIIKFTHTPGVYYDLQGQLHQVVSTWKVVIRIDIQGIDIRGNQIQKYLRNTQEVCNQQKEPSITWELCENSQKIVKKGLDRVQNITERLHNIYKNPREIKRGLVDGIGSLTKSLFGIMDANDEKIINEQLSLIENKQETLQHAIANQLKIINTTINHLDNLEQTLETNEQILWNTITQLYTEETGIILRQHIDEHFTILTALLNDLIRDQNDIVNYLDNIQLGNLPINLTPINSIVSQLQEVAIHLPKGTRFPFTPKTENWLEIKKFLTISAYYKNKNIFTILYLPLITYNTYEIVHIHPFPVYSHDNIFALTSIAYTQVAINQETNTYLLLQENELTHCIKINNQYICPQQNAIYRINEETPCEIQMYTTLQNMKNCHLKYIIANHTFVIALTRKNTWLYSTNSEQTIHIQCKEKTFYEKISKTGIIHIKDQCKVIIEDKILQAQGIIKSTLIQTHIPEYNITLEQKNLNVIKNKNEILHVKPNKIIHNPSELVELSNRITQTYRNLENNSNSFLHYKNIMYTTAPSGVTIVIVIIIAIIVIKKIKNGKNSPIVIERSNKRNIRTQPKPILKRRHSLHVQL